MWSEEGKSHQMSAFKAAAAQLGSASPDKVS
jgi:hypothetical protein